MTLDLSLDHARELDRTDPLRALRHEFTVPVAGFSPSIYLCGNSLGLQPRRAVRLVDEALEDWRRYGVHGHLEARHAWLPYHEFLTNLTAQLVGAQPREVVNMNTLTVNLHLMMVSFFRPTASRPCILIEKGAFPSDRYAVESQLRFHGLDPATTLIEAAPRAGEDHLRTEDLEALLAREGQRIALVLLPGVQYYTGQVLDMARITRAAQAQGCTVGFDLAHAVGNVPLDLHGWGVDFAAWCNYKYMNSGPGAVAGCFVHERHHGRADLPRFAGWWGHDKASRFQMGPDFQPIGSVEAWQLSNPPILALAPVLGSLEVFAEAGMMGPLRDKSLALTAYLQGLLDARCAGRIATITPREPAARGCQLSLRVLGGDGRAIHEALEAGGVICDWREPDCIRVAPTPLYNRFEECWRFVDLLAGLVSKG
jgi:kynureninase